MFRFAWGAVFPAALYLISVPASAAPLPGETITPKSARTPAPAFPLPDETASRSTPPVYRAPAQKGQLPPGFVFPADGSLSDVVRALNELRAYDEGRRAPTTEAPRSRTTEPVQPRSVEPTPPPRAVRVRPAQAGMAQPLVPPLPVTPAQPATPAPRGTSQPATPPADVQSADAAPPASNYVYRSYRTRSGARVVELVERPANDGIELLSNIPQRPPKAKPAEAPDTNVPAERAVSDLPRAFALP